MIYHFAVKSIEIQDATGTFAEWANASEKQAESDIERWQEAYFQAIVDAVKKYYPGATVTMEETNDTPRTTVEFKRVKAEIPDTIDIDGNDDGDGWGVTFAESQADEQVKATLIDILDTVSNHGTFWNA